MRKIVSLSGMTKGESYERQVFAGFADVEFVEASAQTEEEVIELLKDAEVALFTSTKFTENVLAQLKKLKLIVRYGIGYDTVDLEAARKRGVYVCNSPRYGVTDVAEHAVALMFAVSKRLVAMNDRVRANNWGGAGLGQGARLAGKTIGFLGFGNIGRAVCKRANACEMKPVVYDPYIRPEVLEEYGAEGVTMEELLTRADVITCHLPLNDMTFHTLGKDQFARMKKSAILINTSRGGVINEAELIDALEAGELAGVGLDVFEDESGGMDQRLLNVPNAVLTPHIAWNTPEAMISLHHEVADNVARYLRGERPECIVNGL